MGKEKEKAGAQPAAAPGGVPGAGGYPGVPGGYPGGINPAAYNMPPPWWFYAQQGMQRPPQQLQQQQNSGLSLSGEPSAQVKDGSLSAEQSKGSEAASSKTPE